MLKDTTAVLSGKRLVKTSGVCEKFDRKKSWVWQRLKEDPAFPRPRYVKNARGEDVLLGWVEAELDQYIDSAVTK